MKILLRNTKTHLYATGNGQWIRSRDEAHDFGKSPLAYQHAKEHRLANAEVVFAYDDRNNDFTLPPKNFPVTPARIEAPVEVIKVASGGNPAVEDILP